MIFKKTVIHQSFCNRLNQIDERILIMCLKFKKQLDIFVLKNIYRGKNNSVYKFEFKQGSICFQIQT